jgi:hypothetical protein
MKRCIESFAALVDDLPVVYGLSDKVANDDPIAKRHPQFFEDISTPQPVKPARQRRPRKTA